MLEEANTHYHIIGDAEKVGNIKDAIHRGYEIAKDI